VVEVVWPQNQVKRRRKDGTLNKNAREHCELKLWLPGGGVNVVMKIWSNGRTTTSGCKDRGMLVQANVFVATVILFAAGLPLPPDYAPLLAFANLAPLALPGGIVRVVSAPLLVSWDTNLSSVGGKLDSSQVSEFLSRPEFSDRVAKVTNAKKGDLTSRLRNLSLYIRKDCLKLWPAGANIAGHSLGEVYVNVYESGKCSIMSVPSVEVAEEVANLVTDLVMEVYEETLST